MIILSVWWVGSSWDSCWACRVLGPACILSEKKPRAMHDVHSLRAREFECWELFFDLSDVFAVAWCFRGSHNVWFYSVCWNSGHILWHVASTRSKSELLSLIEVIFHFLCAFPQLQHQRRYLSRSLTQTLTHAPSFLVFCSSEEPLFRTRRSKRLSGSQQLLAHLVHDLISRSLSSVLHEEAN